MNYEKYYYMCKTYTWIEIDGDFAKCLTEKTKIGDECCEPDEENDPVNPFFEDVSPRDCKPLSRAFCFIKIYFCFKFFKIFYLNCKIAEIRSKTPFLFLN